MDYKRCEIRSIGTCCEHSIHHDLKHLFEPKTENHECSYLGFIADIKNDSGIIEIQTKSFERLDKKLTTFLPHIAVQIVFPAVRKKQIVWVDPLTGESTKARLSPKTGTIHAVLPELYKIRQHLLHVNLQITVVPIDVVEHRLLNGWSFDRKRGSVRQDAFPLAFGEKMCFLTREDYALMIPEGLPSPFTAKMFAQHAKLSGRKTWYALQLLLHLHCIEQCGKSGNAFLYHRV